MMPSAESLGIITFQAEPEQAIFSLEATGRQESDNIVRRHQKAFNGIGCFKDKQVHIAIAETVKPEIAPPRPVPFHLKDKFQRK